MLSDATLERVSVSYRRGYRDGAAGREPFHQVKPEFITESGINLKPFADYDYKEGYKSGENDAAPRDQKTGRRTTPISPFIARL